MTVLVPANEKFCIFIPDVKENQAFTFEYQVEIQPAIE